MTTSLWLRGKAAKHLDMAQVLEHGPRNPRFTNSCAPYFPASGHTNKAVAYLDNSPTTSFGQVGVNALACKEPSFDLILHHMHKMPRKPMSVCLRLGKASQPGQMFWCSLPSISIASCGWRQARPWWQAGWGGAGGLETGVKLVGDGELADQKAEFGQLPVPRIQCPPSSAEGLVSKFLSYTSTVLTVHHCNSKFFCTCPLAAGHLASMDYFNVVSRYKGVCCSLG
jgi:hypothetical protein